MSGAGLPDGPAGGIEARSHHADPERASTIKSCLERAKKIASLLALGYPERLAARIPADGLLSHPWTTGELRTAANSAVQELSSLGESWLSGLPPVSPILLEDRPLVIIIDGVSPDLWIESMEKIDSLPGSVSRHWARLEVDPNTVSSIAGLFGFSGDPVEEFALRDILYYNLSGGQEHSIITQILPLAPEKCAVIRLAAIDRGAHSGELHLSDMVGILKSIIEKELPAVCRLCEEQKRRLILTTDHGLSSTRGALIHGKGGPYERAIFRAEWAFNTPAGDAPAGDAP
ncbi:hypothetical protein ES703_33037 [subsurface metagenome]